MNVWDYTYDGAGNWPFNAAYAHTYGLDSFVTRLRSLAEVERFIAAGIPVVDLAVVGPRRDARGRLRHRRPPAGDHRVHRGRRPDPQRPRQQLQRNVRSVYTRENFEKVWQGSTGGVAYIYHPKGNVRCRRTCRG